MKKNIKSFLSLCQCEAKDNAKAVHLLPVDSPADYNGLCRLVSNLQITPFLTLSVFTAVPSYPIT